MSSKVIRNVTKILTATSGRLFGRVTSGTGRAQELTPADVRSLLSVSTTLETAALLAAKADLVSGLVPASQLPSYVDDVIEVANLAAFPATGETGKIYVALDTSKTYRWSGSAYVELTDSTAVWGSISGTLSSQTDLQSALNGKASSSHTHAQSDITNLTADLAAKQAALVSGTNIKTINSASLLGPGDLVISGGSSAKGFRAVSGHYYNAQGLNAFGAAVSIAANTLYAVPFRFRSTETWGKIFTYVNTAPSGGNLRLGIWCPDDSGDGLSTSAFTLVLDCGAVSLGTTGLKEITGLSVSIDANKIYLLSVLSDQACTLLGQSVSASGASGVEWLTPGQDTAFNFYLTNQFRKTGVTYGSLPSTITGMTLLGTNVPAIGLRL